MRFEFPSDDKAMGDRTSEKKKGGHQKKSRGCLLSHVSHHVDEAREVVLVLVPVPVFRLVGRVDG